LQNLLIIVEKPFDYKTIFKWLFWEKESFLSCSQKKQRENKQPKIKRESENIWFIGPKALLYRNPLLSCSPQKTKRKRINTIKRESVNLWFMSCKTFWITIFKLLFWEKESLSLLFLQKTKWKRIQKICKPLVHALQNLLITYFQNDYLERKNSCSSKNKEKINL